VLPNKRRIQDLAWVERAFHKKGGGMNNNEELAELLGLDEVINFESDSGKIELLRLMEKHLTTEEGLNGNFWEWVYCLAQSETKPERVVMTEYMLNTTGLLSQAAREWLRRGKMNPNNYGTLEACQRLLDAGIVLETDCYHRVWVAKATNTLCSQVVTKDQMLWNKHGDDVGDGRDMDGVVYIPAPSMAEVWRELPEQYDHLELMMYKDAWYTIVCYGSDTMERWIGTHSNTNPTDALIDLLIWTVRKRKEEK
jgi:hypothetical protein